MGNRRSQPTLVLDKGDETRLSTRQVAAYLGVSRQTVERLMGEGSLGTVENISTTGRNEFRVRYGAVREWLEGQGRGGG